MWWIDWCAGGLISKSKPIKISFPISEVYGNCGQLKHYQQRQGAAYRKYFSACVFTNNKKKTSVEYTYTIGRLYCQCIIGSRNDIDRQNEKDLRQPHTYWLYIIFFIFLPFPLSFGPHDRTTHLVERKQVNAPTAPLSATLFVLSVFFILYYLPIYIQFILLTLHRPLIFPV